MSDPGAEPANPVILPRDFDLYQPALQRNEDYNPQRLVVRRRLDAIGKHLAKELSTKQEALVSRASLHHPYRFNGFRVSSQFVYLSRGEKERKDLKRILGVELGKDLDQNYAHAILALAVNQDGVAIGLRIHKDAWWDGENLKRQLASAEARQQLAALLRDCPEYGLRIDEFRRVHACATMTDAELAEMMKYFTPGNHWLHLERELPRDSALISDPDQLRLLTKEFQQLLPVYRAIRWSKKNNHLFS